MNIPLYHPVLFLGASTNTLGCTATTGTVECESLPTGLIHRLLSLLSDDRRLKRRHLSREMKDARLPLVSGILIPSQNQGRVKEILYSTRLWH